MGRYTDFDHLARDTEALRDAYKEAVALGGGSILMEDGDFLIDRHTFPDLDPRVVLYLGSAAWVEVRDGLIPPLDLTVPETYAEALESDPTDSLRPRHLYWSSATPPSGLDEPPQTWEGPVDVTIHVPEALEQLYEETVTSKRGSACRAYFDVWQGYLSHVEEPLEGASESVESPDHYTWLGQSLAALGLSDAANVESWDVLDAAFGSDPLLWNCGKYLLRQGRKGGEEKRLEDLRKARQYLDRRISQLSKEVSD